MAMKKVEPTIPRGDPRFVYVPAEETDIRKTFERFRQNPSQNQNKTPQNKSGK